VDFNDESEVVVWIAACKLTALVPLLFWQLFFLVSLWLFVACFFLKKLKLLYVSFFLTLIAGLLMGWYYYAHSQCWVTLRQPVDLYGGPSEAYHQIGKLSQDMVCFIEKKENQWVCVKANEKRGWMPVL